VVVAQAAQTAQIVFSQALLAQAVVKVGRHQVQLLAAMAALAALLA
jgi:hypothetical protein